MGNRQSHAPKWKRFEHFVSEIQKALSPDARVVENDRILGASGVQRQIDVAIRKDVGQFKLLIVVDCKDWKSPVDVKGVEEFAGLVEDVSANKGAMVCNSGFSKAAKTRAKQKGIDLFSAVDVESKDWPAYITIPVVCDFISLKSFSLTFRHSASTPFALPPIDPRLIEVFTEKGERIDTISNLLRRSWNEGRIPYEPGRHENIPLSNNKMYVQTGDTLYAPVEIATNVIVERKLYFGHLPLVSTQGFKNELTGTYTTKSFTTADLDSHEVETTWQRIDSIESLAVHTIVTLEAVDRYPLL